MYLKKVEVLYENNYIKYELNKPSENITERIKATPTIDNIIEKIQITDNLLKIEFGNGEVNLHPLNIFKGIHYNKADIEKTQ